MTFQTIPVNVAGPSYQSRSTPLSSQQSKNWYPQFDEKQKNPLVIMPFPGLKEFGDNGVTTADRGLWRMAEELYQVKGTRLYKIDKFGAYTDLGEVPGVDRCIFADDGENLFIVSDLKVWQYNGSTVTEVTDPNITGAKSVDFINNQFLYTKDKFTTVSDVGNGAVASGLNIVGEETKPDDLVRDFVFEQTIWRFGVRTVPAWYNSGVGNPPIERLEGQMFDVGLAAIHSVAQTDEAFYWLGDDNAIYRARAGTKDRISTDAISNEISKYSRLDDAIGFTVTFEGQNFYIISFPTGNKTFAVSEGLGPNGWFEISTGTDGDVWQGTSLINVYGKNIVADVSNGKLYELSLDTYDNNQEIQQRVRVTQSIDATLLGGSRRNRLQMSKIAFDMESGVGLITGQGEDPKIIIEMSDDGGKTWDHGDFVDIGRMGAHNMVVEFDNLDSFYTRMFRITATDPVFTSIYSATIDVRLAGV